MAGRADLRLVLERVLDLLAGVLETGFRLVDFASVLGAFISGHLAESLFGFAADVVDLVACLVFCAHDASPSIGVGCGSEVSLEKWDTSVAVIRNLSAAVT
jgi:hypothetical protein